jgi:hypothetical protein
MLLKWEILLNGNILKWQFSVNCMEKCWCYIIRTSHAEKPSWMKLSYASFTIPVTRWIIYTDRRWLLGSSSVVWMLGTYATGLDAVLELSVWVWATQEFTFVSSLFSTTTYFVVHHIANHNCAVCLPIQCFISVLTSDLACSYTQWGVSVMNTLRSVLVNRYSVWLKYYCKLFVRCSC